jgi:indolepyruvate ferredoxin oxidoreductase
MVYVCACTHSKPEDVHVTCQTDKTATALSPPLAAAQEERLYRYKLPAVLAFSRENKINAHAMGAPLGKAKLGIMAAGKSYTDVVQALQDLGITDSEMHSIGISVYKVGMVWPLEPDGVREYAEGLEELLIVEEKRSVVEAQVKDMLYHAHARPRVLGKKDSDGVSILFKEEGEVPLRDISRAIEACVARACKTRLPSKHRAVAGIAHSAGQTHSSSNARGQAAASAVVDRGVDGHAHASDGANMAGGSCNASGADAVMRDAANVPIKRLPFFCAGCPHNTGTSVIDGALALGGQSVSRGAVSFYRHVRCVCVCL